MDRAHVLVGEDCPERVHLELDFTGWPRRPESVGSRLLGGGPVVLELVVGVSGGAVTPVTSWVPPVWQCDCLVTSHAAKLVDPSTENAQANNGE